MLDSIRENSDMQVLHSQADKRVVERPSQSGRV